jgi:hypothetical protein
MIRKASRFFPASGWGLFADRDAQCVNITPIYVAFRRKLKRALACASHGAFSQLSGTASMTTGGTCSDICRRSCYDEGSEFLLVKAWRLTDLPASVCRVTNCRMRKAAHCQDPRRPGRQVCQLRAEKLVRTGQGCSIVGTINTIPPACSMLWWSVWSTRRDGNVGTHALYTSWRKLRLQNRYSKS